VWVFAAKLVIFLSETLAGTMRTQVVPGTLISAPRTQSNVRRVKFYAGIDARLYNNSTQTIITAASGVKQGHMGEAGRLMHLCVFCRAAAAAPAQKEFLWQGKQLLAGSPRPGED